jgi:quercetin dioxygenase-like cupin family protein
MSGTDAIKMPRKLFGSFLFGGFECANHVTRDGHRLDLIAATHHDQQAAEDYALCRAIGFRAAREAVRWTLLDHGGHLDAKALENVTQSARFAHEAGLTLIWDLMHYGYPDDLDPLARPGEFIDRFVRYARAIAAQILATSEGPNYYTPVNEISYFGWAAGEVGHMAPFGRSRGTELKRVLVQASIAATDAIWQVEPQAQILNVDPLVYVHAPPGRPDLQPQADFWNESIRTEAFDMLAGRCEPEPGGARKYLGIVGLNYYNCNQWTIAAPGLPQTFLRFTEPTWKPLSTTLAEYQARYGGPLLIAETGASAGDRPTWVRYLAAETRRALEHGVDIEGICWYPFVTSPDWEDPTAFFDGGLFDLVPRPDGRLRRVLARPVAEALNEAQRQLDPDNLPHDLPESYEPPAAAPSVEPSPLGPSALIIQPQQQARWKTEQFGYQTLLAGDNLVVELYTLEIGAGMPLHRHYGVEHVLTVLQGDAQLRINNRAVVLRTGESALVAIGAYHGIHNVGAQPLLVQQVSTPKPWDARFSGPIPAAPEAQKES